MRKHTMLALLMCFLLLLPSLAQAVPVEPPVELLQKDKNSGKFITVDSIIVKYKTPAQIALKEKIEKAALEKAALEKNAVVAAGLTSRADNRPDVRKLLSKAESHLGQPYVYGAAGPHSFDCSGFTTYVFKEVGISLPRVAAAQEKFGTNIAKSELRPGDLVFFGPHSSNINHVGIYVGDNKFIHSSTNKGVIITSLSSSYYVANYQGAARVIMA